MAELKYGKAPAKNDYRTLRMANYFKPDLPEPPKSFDSLERVWPVFGTRNVSEVFPMDGNDQYGDCTIAAAAHIATVFDAFVGRKQVMTTQEVVSLYLSLSGGEDSGLVMLDVMKYWKHNQIQNDTILAFGKLSPHNHRHIKQAISFFGPLFTGFQVTENTQKEFVEETPWEPGELTQFGHAIVLTSFDTTYTGRIMYTGLSWGRDQEGSEEWEEECVDELYGIVPNEAKESGYIPGFDAEKLIEDLLRITG